MDANHKVNFTGLATGTADFDYQTSIWVYLYRTDKTFTLFCVPVESDFTHNGIKSMNL